MQTKILLLSSIVFFALSGCGTDESTCGPENDLTPNIIPDSSALDTFMVASLGVDELEVLGPGAEHSTLVQAHFNDFTNYQVQLAETIDFVDHPACFIYAGRPVTSGDPIPLHVDKTTFGGLTQAVVLEPDEFEHIPTQVIAQRGYEAEQVSIDVSSTGTLADGDFPAFSENISAPAQPVLLRIGDVEPVDLASSPSIGITTDRIDHMLVQWEPSGADYVEVKILPGAGSETPYAKLRCITFDDGCLEIPAGALAHLALDMATNFQFRIENHFFVIHPIADDNGKTEASALIDTSSTLGGTVLR